MLSWICEIHKGTFDTGDFAGVWVLLTLLTYVPIIKLILVTVKMHWVTFLTLLCCTISEGKFVRFYENYLALCEKVGKSPSRVALEIPLSKPTVTRWSNGGGITDATARKVANYFGVTVEELMGESKGEGIKKDPIPKDEAVSPAKQKLLDSVDGMSDEQLEKLLGLIEEAKKLL